jgi:hypothetical protein
MHTTSNGRDLSPSIDNKQWLLDQFYAIPEPLRSYEDLLKFRHLDLTEQRLPEELKLEIDRLRDRLRLDEQPHPWLFMRLDALEEAVRRAR